MKKKYLNVGSLYNLSSLSYYLGPQLQGLRNDIQSGKEVEPIWDLRNVHFKVASISALISFLSISKKVRDYIGYPIEVEMHWQTGFQQFLSEVKFLHFARRYDLYDWKGRLGGFRKDYNNYANKKNKLILCYDALPQDDIRRSEKKTRGWKDDMRTDVFRTLKRDTRDVFSSLESDIFTVNQADKLIGVTAELIVNSLLHGRDIAFVGFQLSTRGLSLCVSDGGIGFPKSLKNNPKLPFLKHRPLLPHWKALLLGSLINKGPKGLDSAIDIIISQNGYVHLSSFDSEVRWAQGFWEDAQNIELFNDEDVLIPNEIGEPHRGRLNEHQYEHGFHRVSDQYLVGTRVTFEVKF